MTGLLLAEAVVRGEVALDTPLEECLEGARARKPITLGALAGASPGLPRMPLAFIRRVGLTAKTDPYAGSTVRDLVADLGGVRMRSQRMRYSNFGAALLGQALAARAGASLRGTRGDARVAPARGRGNLGLRGAGGRPASRPPRPPRPGMDARGIRAGGLPAWHGPRRAVTRDRVPGTPWGDGRRRRPGPTPRARRGPVQAGLGWMQQPGAPATRMWWHNGGTHGSRAFTGFVPERSEAVAAATNSPKSPDRAATEVWR